MDLAAALQLALKVLAKTADSTTLTPEKFDISTLTLTGNGTVKYTQLSEAEAKKLLDIHTAESPSGDA